MKTNGAENLVRGSVTGGTVKARAGHLARRVSGYIAEGLLILVILGLIGAILLPAYVGAPKSEQRQGRNR